MCAQSSTTLRAKRPPPRWPGCVQRPSRRRSACRENASAQHLGSLDKPKSYQRPRFSRGASRWKGGPTAASALGHPIGSPRCTASPELTRCIANISKLSRSSATGRHGERVFLFSQGEVIALISRQACGKHQILCADCALGKRIAVEGDPRSLIEHHTGTNRSLPYPRGIEADDLLRSVNSHGSDCAKEHDVRVLQIVLYLILRRPSSLRMQASCKRESR